jgi:hypothetical protein
MRDTHTHSIASSFHRLPLCGLHDLFDHINLCPLWSGGTDVVQRTCAEGINEGIRCTVGAHHGWHVLYELVRAIDLVNFEPCTHSYVCVYAPVPSHSVCCGQGYPFTLEPTQYLQPCVVARHNIAAFVVISRAYI